MTTNKRQDTRPTQFGASRVSGLMMIALLVQILLLLEAPASAQSIFASLSGTVHDASGAVIAGAQVSATNTSSQVVYRSVSNHDGYFSFTTLPFGTYDVKATANGFASWLTSGVALHPSDSRSLNVELKVANVNEQVEVTASAVGVVLQDSGEKSYTIDRKDLQELSLVGRNASEIVKILPGATLDPNKGLNKPAYNGEVVGLNFSLGGQTGGLSAVRINGQYAEITQDGQRTMDPGAFGSATPVVPNPDMISEVKVMTSNFTAENAQGPVVMNSVTQSGGNQFHGNLRLYARNTALNSEDQFSREAEVASNLRHGALKPASSYYYPGFSIGGPIILPGTGLNKSRRKLFFFDGFEYYKQQIDGGVERAFVPTPAMLNGDFSSLAGYTGPTPRGGLYGVPTTPQPCVVGTNDDGSTNPCKTGWWAMGGGPNNLPSQRPGCTITGGVMSPECIDPNAQALLQLLVPPTTGTTPDAAGFNYVQSSSVAQNSWQNMVRGDYNITDATKAYVTWSRHRETNNMPFGLWNSSGDWAVPSPSGVVGNNGADNYTATLLHVFSPTMTAEGKFGYMKLDLPSAPTNPKRILRSESGFPLTGYYTPANVPAVVSWNSSIPNFGDVGHSYHPTMIAVKGIPSASAALTKVFGSHTTKYGFYWEHLYNKQDNWGQYMGVFQYASWAQSATGNEYADMLMGIGHASYFEQAQPPASEIAQNIASFYAQDDWRLTRRITIQYGMRFEHIAKPYAPVGNFGMAVFDAALYPNSTATNPGVIYHGVDSHIPLSGVNSRALFYSPRFGAAIDVFGTGRTVVRGGWGKYRAYDSVQGNQYTGPAGTALGSVGFGCGLNDPNCPTWEDIDAHSSTNCTAGSNCAPPIVFGNPQLQNTSFSVMNPRFEEQPMVTSYSLNVDQQLPAKFVLELSYVGNHSDFLQGTANLNAIPIGTLDGNPGCTSASCQQPYRPFNKYQNITGSVTAGKAQFDSMQASLQRNVGFMTLQANYTWSKALGVGDPAQINNGTLMGALPDYGAHFLWGVLPIDRAQVFSAAYVFRLPTAHTGNRFVNGVVNGWELSGITQVESGAQVTNQSGSSGLQFNMNIPNQNNVTQAGTPDVTIYPLITCNPTQGIHGGQFVNPNCFSPTPHGSLGTGSAPYMPGPKFWNSDLSLLKHMKITERQGLEFRFATFNPLNHGLLSYAPGDSNLTLNFNDLGQVITGTSCQATSGGTPCAEHSTFGKATHHYGYRTLEFGVKYIF